MVVLRIWSDDLFVTSPIYRARWGSIDGRGRLFGRVTWAAFVPVASCRAGAGCMSHRGRNEVAASSHRAGTPSRCRRAQAKNVDKSCDRHPLHGRKTLFDSKKTRFSCAYRAKKRESTKKWLTLRREICVRGSSPPYVFTSLIPSGVAHLRRWRRLVHSPQQRMPSLWK